LKLNRWEKKACRDFGTPAAIVLELSQSSIHCIEDLGSWRIDFVFELEPQTLDIGVMKQIIMKSFKEYLQCPGHIELPDNMISSTEFQHQKNNCLLRVQRLWECWHRSQTVNFTQNRRVSKVLNCSFGKKVNSQCAYAVNPHQRQKA
jgi:hypothetical protein